MWREKNRKGGLALIECVFLWGKEGFARVSYKDAPQRKCRARRLVLAWLHCKGVCVFTGGFFLSLSQRRQKLVFRSRVPINHCFGHSRKTDCFDCYDPLEVFKSFWTVVSPVIHNVFIVPDLALSRVKATPECCFSSP